MSTSRRLNLTWVTVVLLVCGCATSPWSAARTGDSNLTPPAQAAVATAVAPASATTAATSPVAGNPETLNQIMAELHDLGAMDPAAQAKLTEDLKQTDPSLWPLVMQQFRAAMAYKQRMGQPEQLASRPAPPTTPASWPSGETAVGQPPSPRPRTEQPAPQVSPSPDVGRLPPTDNTALPPTSPPVGRYPTTGPTPLSDVPRALPAPTAKASSKVIPAGYVSSATQSWQSYLTRSIAAMETEATSSPQSADEIALHERLRLLYLLAGRHDDALRPIPAVAPTAGDFWAKELAGLDAWLSTEQATDRQRRALEAKQHLGEALASLGEMAPLAVRNLEFCTAVYSYGALKRFEKREFSPDQELLLYAEVENFKSEQTPAGYHTALRGSYQIFDSSGHQVATHEFAKTEETCDNSRRDFFIGYHLRLPRQIYPGKHTLKLTIEDTLSQKIGQASIDFSIKQAKD